MKPGFFLVWLVVITTALHAQENASMTREKTVLDSLNALASKQWLTDSLSIFTWADTIYPDF
jgi:hypothetical protein